MKSCPVILCGLFLSLLTHAEKGKIIFNLDLTPICTTGIEVDSTKLILYDSDSSIIEQSAEFKDIIHHSFDNLDKGKYFLTVLLYQQDYILAESRSGGYLKEDETKEIRGTVSFACAYPILYISWNPDITLHGNDFYNFIIDADSNFIKRYPLDNLDSLSEAFLESGIHYYQECPVNWELLDSNLIPMVHYSFGDYRNPTTTCHTVFAFYDEYLKNYDSLSFAGFRNNANWLLDKCDSNYYLHYEFQFTHQGEELPAGWVSGMAQGLALAALSMAYNLTNEQKYLDGACGVFTTLYRNSGNNFCIGVDEKEYYWLEEYPSSRFCHVFNGMVSGLWGLWCFYTITGENFARVLLEAGIKSITDNYPQWNCHDKDLSYYCLHHNIITTYHEKHVSQLRYFGDYFNIKEFQQAADCFSNKYFAAYPQSIRFSSDKDTSEITLFSTLDWDLESAHDWLTFQQTENKLNVYCSEYDFYQSRTAQLRFTSNGNKELQTIDVIQDGSKIYPLADIDTFIVSSDSGMIWFEVDPGQPWKAECENDWIEAGKVNDTVCVLKYHEISSCRYRTTRLNIYFQGNILYRTLKIIQHPDTVYLSVRPDSVSVSSDPGYFEINIQSSLIWKIKPSDTWLQISQQNDTLIFVSYEMNTSYNDRNATITLSLNDTLFRIIRVTQAGSTAGISSNPDFINPEIYPDPAHDEIHLRFILPQEVPVSIEVFDISGRLISRPFNERLSPAGHDIIINLSGREKGLYLIRFSAGDHLVIKEIIIY